MNFDGVDADGGAAVFGGRVAPPDTNGAVGPNHYFMTTNLGMRIYDKAGAPLTPIVRMSSFMVGIPNAADDDGDPVVLYDSLADRWIISQFNLRVTTNTTHQHVAVSKTGDPTGAYWVYDFLLTHWPGGRLSRTCRCGQTATTCRPTILLRLSQAPFLGGGFYAMERAKMLVGDPTAKIIGFNLGTSHSGMLPTNFQGFTPPPVGTPNYFWEFDVGC